MDKIIRVVYKKWIARQRVKGEHPDEETLACFMDAKLSLQETERIKAHLIGCDKCADAVAIILRANPQDEKEVPEELLSRIRANLPSKVRESFIEIIVKLKEKGLELLSATGDILVGQELVPARVLRSRSIKDFKDEITILKDSGDISLEAKIENKGGNAFNLLIAVKQKETQKLLRDLRVTLVRDDLEMESYLSDSGSVTFEHVLPGRYKIEIYRYEEKLASVDLDVKI